MDRLKHSGIFARKVRISSAWRPCEWELFSEGSETFGENSAEFEFVRSAEILRNQKSPPLAGFFNTKRELSPHLRTGWLTNFDSNLNERMQEFELGHPRFQTGVIFQRPRDFRGKCRPNPDWLVSRDSVKSKKPAIGGLSRLKTGVISSCYTGWLALQWDSNPSAAWIPCYQGILQGNFQFRIRECRSKSKKPLRRSDFSDISLSKRTGTFVQVSGKFGQVTGKLSRFYVSSDFLQGPNLVFGTHSGFHRQ